MTAIKKVVILNRLEKSFKKGLDQQFDHWFEMFVKTVVQKLFFVSRKNNYAGRIVTAATGTPTGASL